MWGLAAWGHLLHGGICWHTSFGATRWQDASGKASCRMFRFAEHYGLLVKFRKQTARYISNNYNHKQIF